MVESTAGMIEGRDGHMFSYFAEIWNGRVVVCGYFEHQAYSPSELVYLQ